MLLQRIVAAPVGESVALDDWLEAWATATVSTGAAASVAVDGGGIRVDGSTARLTLKLAVEATETVVLVAGGGCVDTCLKITCVGAALRMDLVFRVPEATADVIDAVRAGLAALMQVRRLGDVRRAGRDGASVRLRLPASSAGR